MESILSLRYKQTKTNNMRATRPLIAETFKTDDLTTHNILQNTGYGFFDFIFGADADAKWREAHIHDGEVKYHAGVNIEFLKAHFELFASRRFWVHTAWVQINGKMKQEHLNGYTTVEPVFVDKVNPEDYRVW